MRLIVSCEQREANPASRRRHLVALLKERDRTNDLAALHMPCCVVHGTTDR